MMETPELSFTLAYWVFSLCFVFTPNEFRSAGLTVQNLFSSWLGSEDIGFIQYHIRRSTVTLLLHSGLPLGYFLGMCLAAPEQHMEHILEVDEAWQLYLMVALLVHFGAWTVVVYWSMWNWEQHPISRSLQAHSAPPGSGWGATAARLNTEFRRVDKFTAGVHGARVIVTDSWVLKMLTLRVDSSNQAVRPFTIRLNSSEYTELRDKLHVPIRNSANVVVYQSVSERFLETFREHVQLNQTYSLPRGQELEPCIGCMQISADIKLVQLCQPQGSDSDGECQRCLCRPMWCMSCVGRWFASRQDQQRPETWLSSRVPCPTCRARFCILDVCLVQSST